MNKILIVGGGSFGTAVASILAEACQNDVTLYARSPAIVESINVNKKNPKYLGNSNLSENLKAVSRLPKEQFSFVFLALPSSAIYEFINTDANDLRMDCIVNLAKGYIAHRKVLITDYLIEKFGAESIATLKGPTFSKELLSSPLSGLTLGCTFNNYKLLSSIFNNTPLSLDYIDNIKVVEYLSILKNVYAIIMGIMESSESGNNYRAALFTACLKEIQLIIEYRTNSKIDAICFAGVGDFLLTSLNDQSRNRMLGLMFGKSFVSPSLFKSSVVTEGLLAIDYFEHNLTLEQLNLPMLNFLILLKNGEFDVSVFKSSILSTLLKRNLND